MCWKDPSYRRARRARCAIAVLTPAGHEAGLRTAALPGHLPPVIPAGARNGTRYPWDWDDDAEPT